MGSGRVQYAALPYQRTADGLHIMLITSRETRRWIVPKGWPMKNKAPSEAAEIEALQESGIRGTIDTTTIGQFALDKRIIPMKLARATSRSLRCSSPKRRPTGDRKVNGRADGSAVMKLLPRSLNRN